MKKQKINLGGTGYNKYVERSLGKQLLSRAEACIPPEFLSKVREKEKERERQAYLLGMAATVCTHGIATV